MTLGILFLYVLPMLISAVLAYSDFKIKYEERTLKVGDVFLGAALTFVPIVNWITTYVMLEEFWHSIERWWDKVKDRPLGK